MTLDVQIRGGLPPVKCSGKELRVSGEATSPTPNERAATQLTNEEAPAFRPGHDQASEGSAGRVRSVVARASAQVRGLDYRACAAAVVCVGASGSLRIMPTFTRDMSSPIAALFSS